MSDAPRPQRPVENSTVALFASVVMAGLFILKGNTFNVECVGCLYDPNTKAVAAKVVANPDTGSGTIIKSRSPAKGEYDCNHINISDFRNPPVAPEITADMTANPDKLTRVLTKFASDQRQFRYDYQRMVRDMIDKHNRLCK